VNLKATPGTGPSLAIGYFMPAGLITGGAYVRLAVAVIEDICKARVIIWELFFEVFDGVFHGCNRLVTIT
jgi:hypothetical protein